MLSDYEPVVLSERHQEIHRRYTALGFRINKRPFAGADKQLWYFMTSTFHADKQHEDFSVSLQSGICHQMGTHSIWTIEQAEAEWGSGERPAVSPPSVPEVKAAPVPPPAELQQPKANPLGGLTPERSPETNPPVPERTVVPPPAKTETVHPEPVSASEPVVRERPVAVAESGKAPVQASKTRKKQTSLF